MVKEVIELLAAQGEGVNHLANIDLFSAVRDAAGLIHVHEGINKHLRLDAQVFKAGLADHGPDGVGHAADAELDDRTIMDLFQDDSRRSCFPLR